MQWQLQNGGPSARTGTADLPSVDAVAVRWLWKRLSALLVEGKTEAEAARIAQEESVNRPWVT